MWNRRRQDQRSFSPRLGRRAAAAGVVPNPYHIPRPTPEDIPLQIATTTMRATVVVMSKCILVSLGLLVANAMAEKEQGLHHHVKGTPTQTVIALNETSFQEAVMDPANPLWFLKFYAPWCGHCKRMAPVLDRVAPKLTGIMAIGKIDCTVHKPLCNKFKVRGFPSLMYSMDGEVMEYPGGREESDLISFAQKMSGPAVHIVSNYEEAMAFAAKETAEGVAFLGFDPKSTATSEPMTEMQQIFNQVARKRQATAYFVWLKNAGEEQRTYPFIHKIEPNIQPKSYADHDVDIAQMTTETLLGWVQFNNIPLVSELSGANFNRVGRNGRPLALSIVDFDKADQKKAVKQHLLAYASSLPTKDADKYYFGIMDGRQWAKFLTQFNVHEEDNPQMLIMDVPAKKFYQNETYKNVVDFMKAMEAGEIRQLTAVKPKADTLVNRVEDLFLDYFPYSLILVVCVVIGFVYFITPSAPPALPPMGQITVDQDEILGEEDDDDDDVVDVTPPQPESKKDQ